MAKQTKDVQIFFRTTRRNKKRIEDAARQNGFENPSAWLRRVVDEALERSKMKQQAA
jgi:hypothetical protein